MKLEEYIEAGKRASAWQREKIKEIKGRKFDTIAVHGLYSMQEALDFNQGAVIEPIYMSSSQCYRDANEMEAALTYQIPTWCYSRIANPSIYYLENVLALLEGYGSEIETSCIATASGMSAILSAAEAFIVDNSYLEGYRAGKKYPQINFVGTCQVYGGTFQQFSVRKNDERKIQWRKVVNSNDISEWESKIDENTRFLYGEMPSNPTLSFFDLKKVIELAHKYNLPMIVDSTVATPALLRPLTLGADIVIQSVTKTLSSSGFAIGGAIIARKNIVSNINNDAMKADFCSYLKTLPNRDNGPNLSPFNAIMSLNDIRTLRMRVDAVSKNTEKISEFLASHKHIEKVDYLGLKTHALHELATKYLYLVDSEYDEVYGKRINRYGHLMSFNIKGNAKETRDVFDAFRIIMRATDLGRIKSIATIPAISTHQQQGEEARKLAGIPSNLIRLCVGAENADDLIKDIDRALSVLDGNKVSFSFPEFSAGGASSAKLGLKNLESIKIK